MSNSPNVICENKLTVERIKKILVNNSKNENKPFTTFTLQTNLNLMTNNNTLTSYDENTESIQRRNNIIEQGVIINTNNDSESEEN